MLYKPDWEKVKEKYRAFWRLENKKPLVAVTAPREKPVKKIRPLSVPSQIAELNTDHWYAWALEPEYAVNQAEIIFNRTYYGGEAFPYHLASFGPDMSAAYLGVEPRFDKDTTWFRTPVIEDWDNLPDFRYDPDNKWWQITRRFAEEISRAGEDKFLTGISDILSGLDTLVSLRGGDRLLLDLIDHGERVKKLTEHVTALQIRWYEEICRQISQIGSVSWLGIWSPGKWYVLQCDFAHMISPNMFEEFVVPYLVEQNRYLDNSIYHLDGKGQIAHLDILLNIKELDGIQWNVPVILRDPPNDSVEWYPYFKRIQKAGKFLVILCVRPENVKRLIRDLSPEGLFISTSCNSEKEAKELLDAVKLK